MCAEQSVKWKPLSSCRDDASSFLYQPKTSRCCQLQTIASFLFRRGCLRHPQTTLYNVGHSRRAKQSLADWLFVFPVMSCSLVSLYAQFGQFTFSVCFWFSWLSPPLLASLLSCLPHPSFLCLCPAHCMLVLPQCWRPSVISLLDLNCLTFFSWKLLSSFCAFAFLVWPPVFGWLNFPILDLGICGSCVFECDISRVLM